MPSTTGIRRRLSPAMLAGAPYRIGDHMAERYLVKDAIGLGPLGYVFRATDEQQGFDVAVKMIHPRFVQTNEEREGFTRALEPARRFLQPSLARVHDLGVDQGWPYFTYSFLDGLTLRRMIDSRLAKGQTFTLEEVEPFLGQLAAALEASHPIGAHADLKPENVVILPDMLRVVDWGVARGVPRLPFVQAQRQKSTHRYLAPEVVAGADPNPRADLYALGVLVGEMLTGLTPDEDIPELRLTAPELPEAVEGFYRRALNERPEARFRSVRELYEEFLSLLAPVESAGLPASAAVGDAAPSPEEAIETLEPLPDPTVPSAAPAAEPVAPEPAPMVEGNVASGQIASTRPEPEPIAAAALPRLEGHGVETHRHGTREVIALEPPAWNGTPPPAETRPVSGSGRWRALRLWDARETPPGERGTAPAEVPLPDTARPAAEATGPQLPLAAGGSPPVRGDASPARNGSGPLEHSDEEADLAVAGLTEMEDGPALAEGEPGDEPLLAEALGVDLLVDGDEPVPTRAQVSATPAEPLRETPRGLPPAEPSAGQVPRPVPAAVAGGPASLREVTRVPDARPWATEPAPAPYRRDASEVPRTREAPVLQATAARTTLPGPPSIPPLQASMPRLSPSAPAGASAPTPVSVVPEPSPTRQEKVVVPPPPPPEAVTPVPAAAQAPARGAGSWSPAELLAQVIAEIRAEERAAGVPRGPSWEPVPLDATQPISTEEVAARMAAEAHGFRTATVAARDEDEDLPALRHEAGRAGSRMALIAAAGLILGILGAWTISKLVDRPPRPQAERIAEPQPAHVSAPRN